jgi:peptidoglycan DL-endopeptidase CwlO
MTGVRHHLRRATGVLGAVAVAVTLGLGDATADPAADALARLDELSQQALQSRQAVTAAQRDADVKAAEQAAAAERHRKDLATLQTANAQLGPFQAAVDRLAAMTYMSDGDSEMAAVLTASSPQHLIDRLSLQRLVDATTADQMKAYRAASERAATAARASEKSAADSRAAAERATAIGVDLQAKLKDLMRQIAAAEAQYAALTPQQQAVIENAPVIAAMPAVPPGDLAPPPPAVVAEVPESLPVGVANEAGLQPNTILAARAISAQFPQIAVIDGVRPDSKPWHPRGLAIDIMIPNPGSPEGIALGDAIRAFAMANAGRFGLQDVIWRGTYSTPAGPQASGYGHFDHVHITTTPRG